MKPTNSAHPKQAETNIVTQIIMQLQQQHEQMESNRQLLQHRIYRSSEQYY